MEQIPKQWPQPIQVNCELTQMDPTKAHLLVLRLPHHATPEYVALANRTLEVLQSRGVAAALMLPDDVEYIIIEQDRVAAMPVKNGASCEDLLDVEQGYKLVNRGKDTNGEI